jgi:hypothetical protein
MPTIAIIMNIMAAALTIVPLIVEQLHPGSTKNVLSGLLGFSLASALIGYIAASVVAYDLAYGRGARKNGPISELVLQTLWLASISALVRLLENFGELLQSSNGVSAVCDAGGLSPFMEIIVQICSVQALLLIPGAPHPAALEWQMLRVDAKSILSTSENIKE